jgi:hypothetical protein
MTTQDPVVDRRQSIVPPSAWMYLAAVVALGVVIVLAVVTLTVAQPDKDNTSTILLIRSVVEPMIWSLMAAGGFQVVKGIDGRFSQLLAMTARTHAAEGELKGQAVATAVIAEVVAKAPETQDRRAEDKIADATLKKIETNTRETSEGIQQLNEPPEAKADQE